MCKCAKLVFLTSLCMILLSGCHERNDIDVVLAAENDNVLSESSVSENDELMCLFSAHDIWCLTNSVGFVRYLMFDTTCSGHFEMPVNEYYDSGSFLYSGDSDTMSFVFSDGLCVDLVDLRKTDDVMYLSDSSDARMWSFSACDYIIDANSFFVRDPSLGVEDETDDGCCGAEECECNGDTSLCITYNSEDHSDDEYSFF